MATMGAVGAAGLLSLLTLTQLLSFGAATDIPARIVEGDSGVVATDHRICSNTGVQTLQNGGNAVDCAVSVALCLGVVQSESSGIGGGDFMLLRLASGHARAYDMREVAPLQASEDMYADSPTKKSLGGLAVAVPGELKGLYKVWKRYGTLPWKHLVEPAIRLAREGFIVEPYLASKIQSEGASILADDGLREVFSRNGTLLREGDICYRTKLAETLTAIAENGSDTFYRGSIARALAADVKAAGGILSEKDLSTYKVKVTAPITFKSWGHTWLGFPPPSSGGVGLALILNILDAYKTVNAVKGKLGLHHIVEAFKHTYAVRSNLGDPDFVNVTGVVADMLSKDFAAALQQTIADNTTFPPTHYGGKYNRLNEGSEHGTSHFSVVDRHRNSVAMTCTINDYFGAKFLSRSTGVILNDEMGDFATPQDSAELGPPNNANFIKPGKRPLSTMSPTIGLQNGQLKYVIGGSGGIKILTTVAQVLLHLLAGADPVSAVKVPQVHHQLLPDVVYYENYTTVRGQVVELSRGSRRFLMERGHVLTNETTGAIAQFIVQDLSRAADIEGNRQDNGTNGKVFYGILVGVSDFRKDGYPAGY